MKKIIESVVCAGCTCLCDDIDLMIDNQQVIEAKNACRLGEMWFRRRSVTPGCAINGKRVDFRAAVDETVKLLRQSKSPLVCGLDGLSTRSQIGAVEIAKQIRAAIDTTFTNRQRGGMLALQSVGKVTATLGEVASRADVVLFWFCDPTVTHPRFFERFCKKASQTVLIDDSKTETAKHVSQFIKMDHTTVDRLLSELLLSLHKSYRKTLSRSAQAIVDVLQTAYYAASIYGEMDDDPAQYQNLQALYQLTRQLNQRMRAVAIGLRNDANAQSAENVLAWNSGYPFGVNFGRGIAEYNGLEFSAESLLERGECDLAVICSTTSLGELSNAAMACLKQIPAIVIGDIATELNFTPAVSFGVGLDRGDWCRMDDVALPVSPPFVDEDTLTAGRVLQVVMHGLKSTVRR